MAEDACERLAGEDRASSLFAKAGAVVALGTAVALLVIFLEGCPTLQRIPAWSNAVDNFNVVTYNLYWWCVSDELGNCPQFQGGEGFRQLYSRIAQAQPFDLIGFQECDDVVQVVNGAGLAGRFAYFVPSQGNDAAMAWSTARFEEIEGPGSDYVASDQYGARSINWVRLRDNSGAFTVLFCNTHGPLGQCEGEAGQKVAAAYLASIRAHKRPGDVVVFTGDFNCGPYEDTIIALKSTLTDSAHDQSYGGADHILVSGLDIVSSSASVGAPSDHQLLKATFAQSSVPMGCPPDPAKDNYGCCTTTCTDDHFCPSNKGCYAAGDDSCPGGYCPAPGDAPTQRLGVVT